MNEYDSALVEGLLEQRGFTAAADVHSTDYLLMNTCSVREHAENRVFSLLSQYKALKDSNPSMKIAMLGCMVSEHRDALLAKYPHLDFAVGPEGYRQLPDLLAGGEKSRGAWLGEDSAEVYDELLPAVNNFSGYVAITRGCNNFCSYCIVPHVRGRERSRPLESITGEVRHLAGRGIKEITLLGQNVNSYESAGHRFADIIREVNAVEGVERIRFMTSHPKDLSDELLKAMAECEKAAPHLHLPFQAGSDRILALMNRRYTREHYLKLIRRAKKYLPGVSLTTDIITGFPTETEEEFAETLDLVEQIRFDDAFTYRYSPRPGTKAAEMDDDVPEAVKLSRLDRLIKTVRKISSENLQKNIGAQFTVLIEKNSKKDPDWLMGKTEHNRVAVLPKGDFQPGELVKVKVEGLSGFTLRCRAV